MIPFLINVEMLRPEKLKRRNNVPAGTNNIRIRRPVVAGMSAQTVTRLTLVRPDDWHLHLRDGEVLASVLPDTARRFARAIIMPNLKPPVTTTEQALAYRERILAALPESMSFEPLMALHLTEDTAPSEIDKARTVVSCTRSNVKPRRGIH